MGFRIARQPVAIAITSYKRVSQYRSGATSSEPTCGQRRRRRRRELTTESKMKSVCGNSVENHAADGLIGVIGKESPSLVVPPLLLQKLVAEND
jgi:hypothetical protein